MNLYVTTVTYSDGAIEHIVTEATRFSDLRGRLSGDGRLVTTINSPAAPAFDAFINGPLDVTAPVWAVWFAMDRDPIQTAVFRTNDALTIIKTLENYHGEPSRVTWLSIALAKWCLDCPTTADPPQEGSSVPPSETRPPQIDVQFVNGVDSPIGQTPDPLDALTEKCLFGIKARLTRLERAVRFLGSRERATYSRAVAEKAVNSFPESDF